MADGSSPTRPPPAKGPAEPGDAGFGDLETGAVGDGGCKGCKNGQPGRTGRFRQGRCGHPDVLPCSPGSGGVMQAAFGAALVPDVPGKIRPSRSRSSVTGAGSATCPCCDEATSVSNTNLIVVLSGESACGRRLCHPAQQWRQPACAV